MGLHIDSESPRYPHNRRTAKEFVLQAKKANQDILLGESHQNRDALAATLKVIDEAHAEGYRFLVVEGSPVPYGEWWPSMDEEVESIRKNPWEPLSEDYAKSHIGGLVPGTDKKQRPNYLFVIQRALQLGWEVVAGDPKRWLFVGATSLKQWFFDREVPMVEVLESFPQGKVVGLYGAAHLLGIINVSQDPNRWLCGCTQPSDPSKIALDEEYTPSYPDGVDHARQIFNDRSL